MKAMIKAVMEVFMMVIVFAANGDKDLVASVITSWTSSVFFLFFLPFFSFSFLFFF